MLYLQFRQKKPYDVDHPIYINCPSLYPNLAKLWLRHSKTKFSEGWENNAQVFLREVFPQSVTRRFQGPSGDLDILRYPKTKTGTVNHFASVARKFQTTSIDESFDPNAVFLSQRWDETIPGTKFFVSSTVPLRMFEPDLLTVSKLWMASHWSWQFLNGPWLALAAALSFVPQIHAWKLPFSDIDPQGDIWEHQHGVHSDAMRQYELKEASNPEIIDLSRQQLLLLQLAWHDINFGSPEDYMTLSRVKNFKSIFSDAGAKLLDENQKLLSPICLLWAACAALNSTFLAAWNASFSTDSEKMLWRLSTSYIVVELPLILAIYTPSLLILVGLPDLLRRISRVHVIAFTTIEGSLYWIPKLFLASLLLQLLQVPLVHVSASAFLVIEAFISLRNMPIDVYQQADWSVYFPIIQ